MHKIPKFLWLLFGFIIGACANASVEEAVGTIEVKGNTDMAKVVAASKNLAPGDDEIVIYYYRSDEDYEPWGFWLWAPGTGDGSFNYEFSKDLDVLDGVGYFKFKADGSDIGQSAVNANGEIGFIRRADTGWEGQSADLIWSVAEKGNEIVLFEIDLEPTILGEYVPEIKAAIANELGLLALSLSGRHALNPDPSDNGFIVRDSEGNQIPITDMVNMRSVNDRSNNFASNVFAYLAEDIDLSQTYTIEHPQYLGSTAINTSKLLLESLDNTTPADNYELGALYANGGVEFRLWAPTAEAVSVLLFNASVTQIGSDADPSATLPMTRDTETGVWKALYDETDPEGMFYLYEIRHRSETFLALDPYAKSMDAYLNTGDSGRGAIIDHNKAKPQGGWAGLESAQDGGFYQQREDAIVYELSIRDFTIDPNLNTSARPGSYNAFIEQLPYLSELGVTHIQIMPTLNFYYNDETQTAYDASGRTTNSNYNWGYDPHSYFSPEGWFASDPSDPYARVIELKQVVKAAHELGLRVLLDVVYNHSGNTNLFEQIVPGYYFRQTTNGGFTSASGVGNDLATTRKMVRKLIVDSVRYLVDEYKIDGFRFDLMGLIDTETMERAYSAAQAIKSDILFLGEGWKMYNGPIGTKGTDQNYVVESNNFAVFNDELRDLLKGGGFNEEVQAFITVGRRSAESIYSNLIGLPQNNYSADEPGDSILYIAAHDGLTLADAIAHNLQLRTSIEESRAEIARRAMLGNFFILTGQGVAFLHSGQERGRSKPNVNNSRNETIGRFVRNSYDSADNINQFLWEIPAEYEILLQYTRGLIDIRRLHDVFRLGSATRIAESATFLPQQNPFQLAYQIQKDDANYFLLVNASATKQIFTLPSNFELIPTEDIQVLVDSVQASATGILEPQGVEQTGSGFVLDPLTSSIVVVEN